MLMRLSVDTTSRRITIILAGLVCFATLSGIALTNFIAGVLSDTRVDVSRNLLASGIVYVPGSAPVAARLAEAEMLEPERDLANVDLLARKAVNLAPWDYRNRFLLARVKEAEGDRGGAEQSLLDALNLAPNYTEAHWRLANLMLREGKLTRALPEFRIAIANDSRLLAGTLDLLWRVAGGNVAVVQAATPKDAKSRLSLAQFLLKQSRPSDAITVFAGIDRNELLALPESASFVDSLITQGRLDEARGLWIGVVSGTYAQPGQPLPALWNGGFESESPKGFAQFDWTLARNEYAAPSIDTKVAHSGTRSLRIDFAGRDTTRLDGQVKQSVQVRPGARYIVEFFVKTERLDAPEAPRVVVFDTSSGREVGSSRVLPTGSAEWQKVEFEFTAPDSARAVGLTIRRIPKYSYDKPTSGSLWFDDFVVREFRKDA